MRTELISTMNQRDIAINAIVKSTCDYLCKYPKIESFVLGVSGGADSALVAVLALLVRNWMKTTYARDIQLVYRNIPIVSNKSDEISRADAICKAFATDSELVDLSAVYAAIVDGMIFNIDAQDIRAKIRLGNIKARLRMMYLYDLAQKHNGIVLSTDNYTELLLGFWTLHGDVGDFGMIQNLWKTEVFMLLELLELRYGKGTEKGAALCACREAVPTDGLGITASDLDQFGDVQTYEEVDKIFINMINNGYTDVIKSGIVPKVLTMYENSHYKRENPYNISRDVIVKDVFPKVHTV